MKEFGIQLYTVRDAMDTAENIRMTFRRLREMGYTQGLTARFHEKRGYQMFTEVGNGNLN